MNSIKNRVIKTQEVEWQKVKNLQPDNLKIPYNYEAIKRSIIKHGIAKAYDLCEIDGEMYWLDGHTRTEILNELVAEGHKIPKKLTGNFIEVESKADAVQLLLEVHNQRQNPMDRGVILEMLEEHQIEELSVQMETLNIAPDVENIDYSEKNKELDIEEMEDLMCIKLNYTEEDYIRVKNKLQEIGKTPEQAVWKLLEFE